MTSDTTLPGDSDHSELYENDGYDTPDSGIFDMRRDFHRLGDPEDRDHARKLENDEELAGDPLGAETHRHVAEQEDAP